MKISIITVFPEFYQEFIKTSLVARAVENKIVEFNFIKFSDLTSAGQRIDEPVCGPGAGMIIKPEVLQKSIESCVQEHGDGYKIFFSPQGKKLEQPLLKLLANKLYFCAQEEKIKKTLSVKNTHLILICARYEGIDERVQDYYADLVMSIGDYVLMGGDLPAQVFLEGFLRLIPGVVGKQESIEEESFSGSFLDYPEYGLPVEWKDKNIPEVVRSGNHAQIEKWRKEQAAKKTICRRFDWFISSQPSKQDIEIAKQFVPNHYVALMHNQILVQDGREGNSSITSLDIHDIARSAATYGIKNYFVVSSLQDQHKILNTFLNFWHSKEGKDYNQSRFDAVKAILPAFSLNEAIEAIKEKEGLDPIIIATSAKQHGFEDKIIDYFSQGRLFALQRPVLILFGTAQGLSDQVLDRCDYLLLPLDGLTDYNHLSVRSAAAIVLDRWLGLKPKVMVEK